MPLLQAYLTFPKIYFVTLSRLKTKLSHSVSLHLNVTGTTFLNCHILLD